MSVPLTPAGEAAIADLAQRYRVSDPAVRTLLDAVVRGGGAMAQFSHPELGGSGQWMRGGMTMVGDMFNSGLQSTVSGVCSELASMLASGTLLVVPREPASSGAGFGDFSGLVGQWWPAELGRPSSSGGQNDTAYAYFPGPHRLAIRRGETITQHDTGDHVITGVQQQQGSRGSLEFSSQFGTFTVDILPLVRHPGPTPPAPQRASAPPAQAEAPPPAPAPLSTPPPVAEPVPARPAGVATTAAEIGAAIETLAGLLDKGFLSDEEFSAKKAELLARL
jgi:hypothetical protein